MSARHHAILTFLFAAGLARGARANPAPTPGRTEAPAPVIVTELPLHFSARGNRLPVPLLEANLYGTDALVIVDTGSSHQAITRDFAAHLSLVGESDAAGRDHVGQAVSTQRAPLGEWRVGAQHRSIGDAVIVPGPSSFGPLGIQGFLSPQNYFETGCLVFDFPGGRLTVLAPAVPLLNWLHERYPGRAIVELPRVTATGLDARKLFLRASLGAGAPVIAELDTAGSSTEFDETLLPPMSANDGATTSSSVTGKTSTVRTVDGLTVHLGGHAFGPMKIKLHRPQAGAKALLGMDLLRQTVLVIPLDRSEPIRLLPTID